MVSSPILVRLCAISSLLALLIVTVTSAAPRSSALVRAADDTTMPGVLIPLYAGQQDSLTRVAPLPQRARSATTATINVTYTGFSPEAQAAFQYAVDLWEPQLTSAVPIDVVATWMALPSGVLGSAGPRTFLRDWTSGTPAPKANHWYPIPLANKLAGVDLDPNDADITANFSSAFPNWYFGTDGSTPAGQYDFVSVVLHELGHGLGFVGSATVSSGNGLWGQGTGFPFMYDTFVENADGTAIIDTSAFPNTSAALADQLQGDALSWDGPAALAANSGQRPRLYAPATWEQGSSYSHLNEATYAAGNVNSLMTPKIGTAEAIHNPGAIALGMFTDIGWAAPNAATTVTVDVPDTCVVVASPSFMNVNIHIAGQALPAETVKIDVLINGSGGFPYSIVADASGTFVFDTQVGITQAGEYTVQASAAVNNQAPVLSNTITVKVVANTAQCTLTSIYLPFLPTSRPELITALTTTPIASRAVTVRGEVFFTGNVAMPATLPEGGQFYLSSSATSAVPGLVDDQLILRAGSTAIFSYDYRRDARPTAQLVTIPRSVLAPYVGQTLTIVFADKYGGQVSATPLYLLREP